MTAVVQIIAVAAEVHVHVVAVVPIIGPVFRPRIDQAEPIASVLEAALPADVCHGKTVDAEFVGLAIGTTETVIRNAIAGVAAALLPVTML